MSAVLPAPLTPPRRAPLPGEEAIGLRDGLRTRAPQNWPLYLFVLLIPLQNIYTQHFPDFGGGFNFLNLMFLTALLAALRCGGRLVPDCAVNRWVVVYALVGVLTLLLGMLAVGDPATHPNALKDQLIAVAFLWLAQWSAPDWGSLRRLLLVSLLPLPYMAFVVLDQHYAVDSWHYSHDLRIQGTFALLGANELAAFFTTAALVCGGLLLTARLSSAWQVLLGGALLAAAIGILFTYSRTAYVAALLGFALIVLRLVRRGRARWLAPLLLALPLLVAQLPASVIERFDSIEVTEEARDESTENRFRYWEIALQRFAQQPVLGVGFHTFHHAEVNEHHTDTHNFYLRELVEKGLVGLTVLLGMLAAIGRCFLRLGRHTWRGSLSHGLSIGLFAAFVALLCANFFGDRFTHYPMIAHFWLYVGLALRALALQRAARARHRAAPAAAAWTQASPSPTREPS